MVTHLFNAQRPLHHREPGVPGQALSDPRLTSGLIADFQHVAPEVCALAFAAAPGGSTWSRTRRRAPGCRRGRTCWAVSRSSCPPETGCRRSGPAEHWRARRCGWTWPWRTWSAWAPGCPPRSPPRRGYPRTSSACRARPDRPGRARRPGLAGRRSAGPGHLDGRRPGLQPFPALKDADSSLRRLGFLFHSRQAPGRTRLGVNPDSPREDPARHQSGQPPGGPGSASIRTPPGRTRLGINPDSPGA